ncbi:Helix-turn-helix domain-containing protein [Actinoalloteichus cyanogriseus DSM 43889]|uniref:Helix-turn-helix domain-containing protein n=1 Tax=Actinoalloteichus caeruleus DSM 43889 TaxID=1120930 RepID=A0ABT1JKY3_ACTCY|nr:Helix-turn-helix domain-containing protein [Actinoalloteichus caeruleus DSM 43889]
MDRFRDGDNVRTVLDVPDGNLSSSLPAVLRPWLSDVRAAVADAGGTTVVEEPDTSVTLLFWSGGGGAVVLGPRTRATYRRGEAGGGCVRMRVRAGRAEQLLGRGVRGLGDRAVPLRELWGEPDDSLPATWWEREHRDPAGFRQAALSWLAEAATRRLSSAPPTSSVLARAELAEAAASALSDLVPRGGVREVSRQLYVSERQLRDAFTSAVGIAPKRFARLNRIRSVLARAERGQLATLAAETGYHDQAHLTTDFRRVMGVPPGAYAAGRIPVGPRCRPGSGNTG